ncbi:MAG: hypothetical protein Q8O43_10445 [Dehalococcoidia bacterium]|nr:hypothetical protein [Dehalococcoidia bacterium]
MVTKVKTVKYAHLPLNRDVEAFAGYYTPEKEVRMVYKGRELFYVTGHVVVETTCGADNTCNTANYWYATVPGYIIRWQAETNKEGLPVTEVEIITDTTTQSAIREIILKSEAISRVDFW